jgi:hypothetical protein
MSDEAQIQILREFDPVVIAQCRALDAMVYDAKYQMGERDELRQIRANPRSRVVARYQDELVGYLEFIPLTEQGFDAFLGARDAVFDLQLDAEMVSPWHHDRPVDLYLASMVVSREFQSKGVTLPLLRGLYLALKELRAEGRRLGRVGATGVSVAGRRFLHTMLGMQDLHEVPGGLAAIGWADDVVEYLAGYLDW